ncbi:MAG: aldehyde dehydrogenase family protein [Anaerolineales bacterium]
MLPFINPATGKEFGAVAMHTPEDVQQAMREMRASAPVWRDLSVQQRAHLLGKFQAVMIDSLDEITKILTQDCGKSRQDAMIEVFITVDMLAQYRKHAARWLARRPVPRGLYLFKNTYVEYRPYGVVAVIAPWNYPFALSIPPVVAALLAGNTVILKPSEVTPAAGMMMQKLFERVPELAPYVRVLHGDGRIGAALVQTKPDYIFLTGSTPTGRAVSKAAAEHLIPIACELGGKDAMIVLDDADLQAAARWGAWGAYFNAGQTCMAVERAYVVESVYPTFVRHAVAETRKIQMGYSESLESPYYMGPVTDPRQIKIIQRHLEDALAKGAKILTGGKIEGMFVEPTVLVNVTHDMLLMQEETFGPLFPIMQVKDEAEAIRMANDCQFGLGASIWSRDIGRAERVAKQVEASSIVINDTIAQFGVPMLPFGGIKQSGYGRIHGKEGLVQFTRPYAYAVGNPPYNWDIATILRSPGHYRIGAAILRIVFGIDLRQKTQPISEELQKRNLQPARLGIALGAFGALALAAAKLFGHRR